MAKKKDVAKETMSLRSDWRARLFGVVERALARRDINCVDYSKVSCSRYYSDNWGDFHRLCPEPIVIRVSDHGRPLADNIILRPDMSDAQARRMAYKAASWLHGERNRQEEELWEAEEATRRWLEGEDE